MNIEIPSFVEERAHATFIVGFGDAVREYVENGDVDREHAEHEANQWTFTGAYRAGFAAGAAWAEQR